MVMTSSASTSIPSKVTAINDGRSPIVEPGLRSSCRRASQRPAARDDRARRRRSPRPTCRWSASARRAEETAVSIFTYLMRVCEQIGDALKDKSTYHVVVIRSTVLPGTTHAHVIPTLEARSGKTYGEGFGVSVNPEFLREGTALKDFRHPPLTLVGHNHASDAAPTKALYDNVDAPLYSTSIRVAEMMKYTSNAWHAVKVVFANEIGNLCKRIGVDSHDVMDIFCRTRS